MGAVVVQRCWASLLLAIFCEVENGEIIAGWVPASKGGFENVGDGVREIEEGEPAIEWLGTLDSIS